jgi:hypothetical protein
MFRLSLAAADSGKVAFWRVATGVTFGAGGGVSIAAIVPKIQKALPAGMIVDQFTHMAVAVSIAAGLTLLFFPRVVSVSLAQAGVATSIILLGYSVLGAFPPSYLAFVRVLIGIIACVLLILFSSSLIFFYRQRSWSDLILGIVLLILFGFLWTYPLTHPLK